MSNIQNKEFRRLVDYEIFGEGAVRLVRTVDKINEPVEVINEVSLDLDPTWVPEAFLPVSPNTEKRTMFWGRIKKGNP